MRKVKDKLQSEQKQVEGKLERRQQREAKKYSKQARLPLYILSISPRYP